MSSLQSFQTLFFLICTSTFVLGDLGFYGEIHGRPVEKKKNSGLSEVLHDVPFKYRQGESLDLDPYSLDFDFMHGTTAEGGSKGNPHLLKEVSSPDNFNADPSYQASIADLYKPHVPDYKSPPSFKPITSPSSPSYPHHPYAKQNQYNFKKPDPYSSPPIYDPYKPASFTKSNDKTPVYTPHGFSLDKHPEEEHKSNNFGGYEELKANNYDQIGDYEDYSNTYQREHSHHPGSSGPSGPSGPSGFHDEGGDFKEHPHHDESFGHHDFDGSGSGSGHNPHHHHGGDIKDYDDHHGSSGKTNHDSGNAKPSYLRVEYGYGTGGSQVKYSYHHGYKH